MIDIDTDPCEDFDQFVCGKLRYPTDFDPMNGYNPTYQDALDRSKHKKLKHPCLA